MRKNSFLIDITVMYLIYLIIWLLSSCSPVKWIQRNESFVCDYCTNKYVSSVPGTEKVSYDTILEKDSIPVIDSSFIELLFECDSLGQLRAQKIDEMKGRYQKMDYELKNGLLTVRSYIDSLYGYKELLKIEKLKTKEVIKTVEKIKEVNKVPWWIYAVFGVIALSLVYKIIRK